jgi:serine/threonine protein kinase
MGTIQYMAPELFEDGRPTKASDVYALGMTAWHVGVSCGLAIQDAEELLDLQRSEAVYGAVQQPSSCSASARWQATN